MPFLLVPPTQVVPFDGERITEQKKSMDEFRSRAVDLWQTKPVEEIKTGAFRRGRLYEWNEPFDALLQTYFIFPSTARERTGEVARIAALFKKENCQLLGSVVVWGTEWTKSLPNDLEKQDLQLLKEASQRQSDALKSPLRLSLEGRGYWATTLAWISESFLGERFAKEGLTVHSDLAGLACFKLLNERDASSKQAQNSSPTSSTMQEVQSRIERDKGKESSQSVSEWKKGHRQVKLVLDGIKPKEPLRWPSTRGKYTFTSLPLNEPLKSAQQISLPESPFLPSEQSQKIYQRLVTHLHNMNEKEIRIVKREGRFVTVDRGLAFGLKIGMHLVGPDGAKLHVIRFDNRNGFEDAAILLIRSDSKSAPLAEGVQLQIDSTVFPAQ